MKKNKQRRQKGQIGLVALLIASVLLTVALALTEITSRETMYTKAEEDAKRARAAAEAGIESVLNSGQETNIANLLRSGSDITGTANVSFESSTTFTTPLISKDGQYTFYLGEYNSSNNTFENTYTGGIRISLAYPESDYCTDADGANRLAVEITMIHTTTGITGRKIIDPCNLIEGTEDKISFGGEFEINFPAHLLLARIIAPDDQFAGAQLRFHNPSGNFYPQGRMITSTATTAGNITKKIQLFQSHPQIPAEFFVTQF